MAGSKDKSKRRMVDVDVIGPAALDTENAARYIGYEPQTLANWRKRKKGPRFVRAGAAHSKVVYMVEDLDQWLRENRV